MTGQWVEFTVDITRKDGVREVRWIMTSIEDLEREVKRKLLKRGDKAKVVWNGFDIAIVVK